MGLVSVNLRCPNCNAPVSPEQETCDWCHAPIVLSSFTSVHDMPSAQLNKYAKSYQNALAINPDSVKLNQSIAICYLKLRLFDKAIEAFDKAIEASFDVPDLYFYAAVSMLKGKKAFLATRADIDRAISYLNAANAIEPKGIYDYLLAYIKYDYFERKRLNTVPDYQSCLAAARSNGLSSYDVSQVWEMLGVSKPDVL